MALSSPEVRSKNLGMKSIGWIVGLAAFVGVFGALELDRALHRAPDRDYSFQLPPPPITRVDYEAAGSPPDFTQAARRIIPSVVSVDRYQEVSNGFFFDESPSQVEQTATGSGVIVSNSGYIVTNNHVVANAVKVRVRTNDHHVYEAKVIGTDPRSDVAVLKIDAKDLKPIEMGNSDQLQVGQWVIAAGNPLGFDDTISVGVVSSLRRRLPEGEEGGEIINAIQTDAAINPGNSGGALTDAAGRLVGINSAIASGTGQSVGIGFAIPINRVREVFNDILRYGYARYPDLGLRFTRQYDGYLADEGIREQLADITHSQNVPDHGVIVRAEPGAGVPSVIPGSSADKQGLQEWDVVLDIDGKPVDDSTAINRMLMTMKPGQKVQVRVWSKGSVRTVTITLDEGRGS